MYEGFSLEASWSGDLYLALAGKCGQYLAEQAWSLETWRTVRRDRVVLWVPWIPWHAWRPLYTRVVLVTSVASQPQIDWLFYINNSQLVVKGDIVCDGFRLS